jgi:mRNA interferase MazF
MARGLRRGDVRLIRFPSPDKPRPALVLTRDSALRFLTRVTIAPITSTVRGIPTEYVLTVDDGMKTTCAVNMDNITTVHRSLVGRRVASLAPETMRLTCSAIAFALGCDL